MNPPANAIVLPRFPHRRWRSGPRVGAAARAPGTLTLALLIALGAWAGAGALGRAATEGRREPLGNLSPADALRAFETEPGFAVELVAAEPLTIDPVALAFDERGRLYVAENRDYPVGSPDGRPLGRIALLEDRDGDGVMDLRREFAEGLRFPNGVMPWRGGVIVTAAPEVFWLCDTNGDGRADVREVWLTGFDTNTTSQLRVNDPTLGPDGWIHFAGGLRGGRVTSPLRAGRVVDTERGDLRFRPDTGEMELVAGKSQYGLAFDDAGNRFACMNRIQSQHAPLPARYLARNPLVTSPGALQDCPDIPANTLMTRYTAGAARYYPISDNLTTADSHFGTYSAACAVHVYRGTLLPSAYQGAAFSCDPTGNLVRGDRLEKVGGTFAARRIRAGTEALRSRDNWFRPVFLADGPEGALYVADMYRGTIEHPEYLPGEVRRHTDFEGGKSQGRIWRLTAAGAGRSGARSGKRLEKTPWVGGGVAALVDTLASDIPWRRDTAFRLLVERREPDPSLVPRLRKALREVGRDAGRDATARSAFVAGAVARLRLLAMLEGLDEATLTRALDHGAPAVRQNALQLVEPALRTHPAWAERVIRLTMDPDPHVRFQAALALGEMEHPGRIAGLGRIAAAQADDRWTRAAVLSSVPAPADALSLLAGVVRDRSASSDGMLTLTWELGRLWMEGAERAGGTGGASGTSEASETARREGWARLGRALEGVGTPQVLAAWAGALSSAPAASAAAALTSGRDEFRGVLTAARGVAVEAGALPVARAHAVELLAFDPGAEATGLLSGLLGAGEAKELQRAVVRALARPGRAAALPALLVAGRWNGYTPAVRTLLLDRMAGVPELVGVLLDAIEAGQVPVGALTPAQRQQLRASRVPELRARSERLLAAPEDDRGQAFTRARAALSLKPVPSAGRAVFEKACASCHRFNQQGVAVGPDLFDIRHQPKESILYHLILPEAEIAPNFVNYECELKDGRTLSGLMAAESATTVTLRMAQGAEETVGRREIVRLVASRLSLMPQELEKVLSLQELADLLAYLRGEQ